MVIITGVFPLRIGLSGPLVGMLKTDGIGVATPTARALIPALAVIKLSAASLSWLGLLASVVIAGP